MPREKVFPIRISYKEYAELVAAAHAAGEYYPSTYAREQVLFVARNGHRIITASTKRGLLRFNWEFTRLSTLISAMPQIKHEEPVVLLGQQVSNFEAFLKSLFGD